MIVEANHDTSASGAMRPDEFSHVPVMLDAIVDVFSVVPSGVILDATVGGGGHSRALLESRTDIRVLAIDRDAEALSAARRNLSPFGDRVMFHKGRFDLLDVAMDEHGVDVLCGALFDLGVSSHQFDVANRGFSYRFDAPLDMRMDQDQELTASSLVNTSSEAELTAILRDYADERFAVRIARAVVRARPVVSTMQLAHVIASAIPAPARRIGGHPAKRTFQALRIAVNDELSVLPRAIDRAVDRVQSGGRIAVLSYHSGEDRIVKERFVHFSTGGCTCPPRLPCGCGARATIRLVRAAARPSDEEQRTNPRSTSARFRVAEVI